MSLVVSAAFVGGVMVGTPAAIDAHNAPDRYESTWSRDADYYVGETHAPLNSNQAKASMRAGAAPWNGVAGSGFDFNWSGTEDPNIDWTWNGCTTTPGYGVWLLTGNLGGDLAWTARCVDGNEIESVAVVFDYFGPSWHTHSSQYIPSNRIDLRGVATHEFGHAAGFRGHFDDDSQVECDGNYRETMCSTIDPGKSYWRSLEEHDRQTFADEY